MEEKELVAAISLLRNARVRIQKGWCQNSYAKTADGVGWDHTDSAAYSFCIAGAMLAHKDNACEIDPTYLVAKSLLFRIIPYWERRGLAVWNDHKDRTQADVLAVIDLAIEKGELEKKRLFG